MKFHNKINLFSLFVCFTTIIINILFPKSIYALIIFLFMEMTGIFILYFWDKTSSKKIPIILSNTMFSKYLLLLFGGYCTF